MGETTKEEEKQPDRGFGGPESIPYGLCIGSYKNVVGSIPEIVFIV